MSNLDVFCESVHGRATNASADVGAVWYWKCQTIPEKLQSGAIQWPGGINSREEAIPDCTDRNPRTREKSRRQGSHRIRKMPKTGRFPVNVEMLSTSRFRGVYNCYRAPSVRFSQLIQTKSVSYEWDRCKSRRACCNVTVPLTFRFYLVLNLFDPINESTLDGSVFLL